MRANVAVAPRVRSLRRWKYAAPRTGPQDATAPPKRNAGWILASNEWTPILEDANLSKEMAILGTVIGAAVGFVNNDVLGLRKRQSALFWG
ncbi:MAG: hypothetical protein CME19_07060 [Gemmatimonadetes bacterium]|nr:hypothetical protein [Gemmatimonadota bacterium]|tara:strand:+ start:2619 stop:2891 length:273 start_codon:yes stop_codon:yes gene_type:complete